MAETKKKGRLFDLPETKGAFQLKGIVSGMEKDTAFKEIKTKSGKPMRMLNFGASYLDGETLYVNIQGMEQENVYFSKRAEKKGEKADTVKVPWVERYSYNREGYRMIGKNIGVKKKVDSEGKTVNDKKILTDFDACKEVKENLRDGASVFIRGSLDYSSFTDDKGNKRTSTTVSYTHLRAHETDSYLVCRLLLEKKNRKKILGRRLLRISARVNRKLY